VTESYFLPSGYESRLEPEYFVDEELNAVWQPDLYPEAATVARRLGSRRIIDVGCGTAEKLARLHPEFEVVGIDFGSNIAACRERYDFGTWIDRDLDSSDDFGYDDVAGSTIVCGDVIEHLVRPERLLRMLRSALDRGAAAVFLSTPDRELTNEPGDLGPPPNPAHVREWAHGELERLLAYEGLHGYFGLTRSNDVMPYMRTIIAAIPGNTSRSEEVVRDWFEERRNWERLAVEQDRLIDQLERWTRQLAAAKDWAEEQRSSWKERAEAAEEQLGLTVSTAEDSAGSTITRRLHEEQPGPMSADRKTPRVTIITEVDGDGSGIDLTAASLAAQTFGDWEWTIVTTDGAIDLPMDDARARIVSESSRARALSEALAGPGGVALLEAGQPLQPTALEKWLWFLEAHPTCMSVRSLSSTSGAPVPRLIRRSAVEAAGSLDAGAEAARVSEGFVPLPDDRPAARWGERAPIYFQPANEWLPLEPAIDNPVPTSGRRLLLIVPWMTVGGADMFNLALLDQLRPLGWEITVATTIDGNHELYPEYERRTLDLFPLAHFLPLPYHPSFLRYLIESRRPDVVLVSNSELGYRLLPYLRGMCPATPFVDFCHSEAEQWNEGGYPRFSIEYGQLLDLTMTASEHLKQWMIERGGNPERIEVCYANVDTEAFRPLPGARDNLRSRLGLKQDEPVVLFVGRISEDKLPRVLAATLTQLRQRGFRFTAVIAGDGPDRGWLDAALKKNLDGRVRMVGSVRSEEVPSLMAAADVLFAPSRSEGIALALYEAMASGTPVVAARVGGQAELVTAECGFLIERSTPVEEATRYADAIELLLREPELRAAMGRAGRARVETGFPLERLGCRVDQLLGRAIELHRTDPRPVPPPALVRSSASETIELMRLARMMDAVWADRLRAVGLRRVSIFLYVQLRRLGRPAYLWGIRRGWSWLPRLRDKVLRVFVGAPA
jgi:glycosyltransferase involved in cell wall biosynthesis/SAM-dependent methyltransferase